MTTQSDRYPTPSVIDLDPEELLIGEAVDIDPETFESLGDDPSDSSLGENIFELIGAEAAEDGPPLGHPINVEDEITSRYIRG